MVRSRRDLMICRQTRSLIAHLIYSHFVLEMLLPQTTAPLYVPLGNLPPIGDPMFKLEVGTVVAGFFLRNAFAKLILCC